MRIISFFLFLLIIFVGVTFSASNAQLVNVNYYFSNSYLPLSLLLVIVLGIGAFIGWLFSLWIWMRLKTENFLLSSRLKTLEKELNQLRTSPVHEIT